MTTILLCFLMFYGEFTTFAVKCNNDVEEHMEDMQPTKLTGQKSVRSPEIAVTEVREDSPNHAQRLVSRVWFGNGGIAPESVEFLDRDDCEPSKDWAGFQEDPDLEEFASSNLRRRSVSNEIMSFDRCKQCDDSLLNKPNFNSGTQELKLKMHGVQDSNSVRRDAHRETRKIKPSHSIYLNSSVQNPVLESTLNLKKGNSLANSNTMHGVNENMHTLRKIQYKRSSEKNKKKQKKDQVKDQKRFEKAIRNMKKKEPLFIALYEDAKKNEEAMKILAGAKRKPKSVTKTDFAGDAGNIMFVSDKSANRHVANENDMPDGPCKVSFEQGLGQGNDQDGGFFKRGVSAATTSLASPQRNRKLKFPEMSARSILSTPDAEAEDDDEESVTVKVYESALKRGNSSLVSNLRFLPNRKKIRKNSKSDHFSDGNEKLSWARNSLSEPASGVENDLKTRPLVPGKMKYEVDGFDSLVDNGQRNVKVCNSVSNDANIEDTVAHEEANSKRIRKSNDVPMSTNETDRIRAVEDMKKSEARFHSARTFVHQSTEVASSSNNSIGLNSNRTETDAAKGMTDDSEETPIDNKLLAISTDSTNKRISTSDVPNEPEVSIIFNVFKITPTEATSTGTHEHSEVVSVRAEMNNVTFSDITSPETSEQAETTDVTGKLVATLGAFMRVSDVNTTLTSSMSNQTATSSQPTKAEIEPSINSDTTVLAISIKETVTSADSTTHVNEVETPPSFTKPQKTINGTDFPLLFGVRKKNKTLKITSDIKRRHLVIPSKNLSDLSNEVFTNTPMNAPVKFSATVIPSENIPVPHKLARLADTSEESNMAVKPSDSSSIPDNSEALQETSNSIALVKTDSETSEILEPKEEKKYPANFNEKLGAELRPITADANHFVSNNQPLDAVEDLSSVGSCDPDSLSSKVNNNEYVSSDEESNNESTSDLYNKIDELSNGPTSADSGFRPGSEGNLNEMVKGKSSKSEENSAVDLEQVDVEVLPESSKGERIQKRELFSHMLPEIAFSKSYSNSRFQSSYETQSYIPDLEHHRNPVLKTNTDTANSKREIRGNPTKNQPTSPTESGFSGKITNLILHNDQIHSEPEFKPDYLGAYSNVPPRSLSDRDTNSRLNSEESIKITHPKTQDFEPHRKVVRRINDAEFQLSLENGKHYDETQKLVNPFKNTPKRGFSKERKNNLVQSKFSACKSGEDRAIEESKIPLEIRDLLSGDSGNTSTDTSFRITDCPSEFDTKIENIISGKVPNRLVDTILAKVDGCGKMGRELGMGAPPSSCYENMEDLTMPSSQRESEVKLQAEKIMMLITKQVRS